MEDELKFDYQNYVYKTPKKKWEKQVKIVLLSGLILVIFIGGYIFYYSEDREKEVYQDIEKEIMQGKTSVFGGVIDQLKLDKGIVVITKKTPNLEKRYLVKVDSKTTYYYVLTEILKEEQTSITDGLFESPINKARSITKRADIKILKIGQPVDVYLKEFVWLDKKSFLSAKKIVVYDTVQKMIR